MNDGVVLGCFFVLTWLFLAAPVVSGECAQRTCTAGCQDSVERLSPLCNCDKDCAIFGDCCGRREDPAPSECPPSAFRPPAEGAMMECRSTFLVEEVRPEGVGDAVWMVSSCPDTWAEDETIRNGRGVEDNCVSLELDLPPVTDTQTGLVYRNEYCALCNGVQTIRAWQVTLACTPDVYQLLSRFPPQEILRDHPNIFTEQCQGCQHQSPDLQALEGVVEGRPLPSPRSCIPTVATCLSRKELSVAFQRLVSGELYESLVGDCETGSKEVVADERGRAFFNRDCAFCNGVEKFQYSCFILQTRTQVPAQCAPMRSTTPPPTEATPPPTGATPPPTETTPPPTGDLPPQTEAPPPLTEAPPPIPPVESIRTLPPPLLESTISTPLTVPAQIPFTITLSNLGGGEVGISYQSQTLQVTVDCPVGQVPVGLECRSTQCPEGYSITGGRCAGDLSPPAEGNRTLANCSLVLLEEFIEDMIDSDAVVIEEDVFVVEDRDDMGRALICNDSAVNASVFDFLDCPTGFVALNDSEYQERGNATIFFDGELVEVMFYDRFGRPLVCADNTSLVVVNTTIISLLPGIAELTYIGCSLSVLGTAVILVTYILFRELRTFPSLLLMNLSLAILVTNLFFVVGGPVFQHFPNAELCKAVAIFLHFFYLAQFVWMSLFSVEMAHTFYLARRMVKVTERRKWCVLLGYMFVGWGVPLLVIAVVVGVNFSGGDLVLYGVTSDGSVGNCWINHFPTFIATFLVPLILSLAVNLCTFVGVSVVLVQSSRSRASRQQTNYLVLVRVWLAVLSVTGLTWAFGFLAVPNLTNWAWYPFVLFNSTQGFLIFVAFLCTKKTLRLYLNLFRRAKLRLVTRTSLDSSVSGHIQQSGGNIRVDPLTCTMDLESRQGHTLASSVATLSDADLSRLVSTGRRSASGDGNSWDGGGDADTHSQSVEKNDLSADADFRSQSIDKTDLSLGTEPNAKPAALGGQNAEVASLTCADTAM